MNTCFGLRTFHFHRPQLVILRRLHLNSATCCRPASKQSFFRSPRFPPSPLICIVSVECSGTPVQGLKIRADEEKGREQGSCRPLPLPLWPAEVSGPVRGRPTNPSHPPPHTHRPACAGSGHPHPQLPPAGRSKGLARRGDRNPHPNTPTHSPTHFWPAPRSVAVEQAAQSAGLSADSRPGFRPTKSVTLGFSHEIPEIEGQDC